MNIKTKKIIATAASIQLTLFCMGLMMFLIFFGTLAQVKVGTFAAQKMYFSSFWVGFLPGGLTVGGLWLINLVAAFAVKFRYKKKDIGLLMTHFGLILLFAGQGLTQLSTKESRLSLQEGQTGLYLENPREPELSLVMTSEPNSDQVISIPYSILSKRKEISSPHFPFTVRVKEFFPNADLRMGASGPSVATQGIGPQISVVRLPVTHKDDEINNTAAFVEIMDGENNLGTWLVSMMVGAEQKFVCQGKNYTLAIRPRREYLPFQLTLKDFRHDIYPGTDIPKNFSSLVHLRHEEKNEDRDVLIYMNHPLRYAGKTFYQASFGNDNTLSIFQVVENPVWLAPYISCALVILGLGIQFVRRFRSR